MRKYLKNETEVIQSLKEGKEVFASTAPYAYKMVDGVICYYDTESDNKLLGLNAFVSMEHAPYIEEQEPFTIEEDKFYKTRNGDKAYCYIVEEDICYFALAGHGHFLTDKSGNYEGAERGFDIVGYWEAIR